MSVMQAFNRAALALIIALCLCVTVTHLFAV